MICDDSYLSLTTCALGGAAPFSTRPALSHQCPAPSVPPHFSFRLREQGAMMTVITFLCLHPLEALAVHPARNGEPRECIGMQVSA